MRKPIHIACMTLCFLLASALCSAQEIRTVVAEGVGSDPQSAAQDAAQNALTNVVGSFIDADKQLEKRTEIRDGIRSQTTQIRTDIKEYSQGSIQSLDIVETKKDGLFYRVTAKVGVRIAEFQAYVKKLAEGEVAVGGGLFAEMATTHKQSESLAKMLSERILAIVSGEAIRFSVSKPVPFRRSRFADSNARVTNGSLSLRFSPDQLAVFEVTAALDEAFLGNLLQTLDSVATSKKRVSTSNSDSFGFWSMYRSYGNCVDADSASGRSQPSLTAVPRPGGIRLPTSIGGIQPATTNTPQAASVSSSSNQQADSKFCLPIIDISPTTATVYRFSNVDHELAQYLPWIFNVPDALLLGQIEIPTLEVAVLDKDKRELQVELLSKHGANDRLELDAQHPWLLYHPMSGIRGGSVLIRQSNFSVIMKIEDNALAQADSIRVRLVK